VPAGEEGVFPWPVGADGEGSLAGVAGKPGGQVPDPVAEGVRVRGAELAVVQSEKAGPCCEVGGDVRGQDPADVDLPGLRREVPQPHGLGGTDAAGLDDGVLAVQDADPGAPSRLRPKWSRPPAMARSDIWWWRVTPRMDTLAQYRCPPLAVVPFLDKPLGDVCPPLSVSAPKQLPKSDIGELAYRR
jgi:hypothetical protein